MIQVLGSCNTKMRIVVVRVTKSKIETCYIRKLFASWVCCNGFTAVGQEIRSV